MKLVLFVGHVGVTADVAADVTADVAADVTADVTVAGVVVRVEFRVGQLGQVGHGLKDGAVEYVNLLIKSKPQNGNITVVIKLWIEHNNNKITIMIAMQPRLNFRNRLHRTLIL